MTEAISDLRSPRSFALAREDKHRYFGVALVLLLLSQNLAASNLGGYSGISARFTADPLSAGTGGITLFENSSTNSFAQNPAALAFKDKRNFNSGMALLSLDRYVYSVNASTPLPPTATLSIGVIAAGTDKIEARDSRGYYAGELTDAEMTYLVSFSNRFSEKLAFGLSLKLLSKRFASEEEWFDIKGTGFGAGLGLLFKPNSSGSFALALKDWNSSYKWNTQDLFDRGSSYSDEFPMSLSWGWFQEIKSISLAFEHNYYFIGEHIYRAAITWHGIEGLNLNAGMSYEDASVLPGLSVRYQLPWKQGPPMHIDLGMRMGTTGEGLRNYLGWGLTF